MGLAPEDEDRMLALVMHAPKEIEFGKFKDIMESALGSALTPEAAGQLHTTFAARLLKLTTDIHYTTKDVVPGTSPVNKRGKVRKGTVFLTPAGQNQLLSMGDSPLERNFRDIAHFVRQELQRQLLAAETKAEAQLTMRGLQKEVRAHRQTALEAVGLEHNDAVGLGLKHDRECVYPAMVPVGSPDHGFVGRSQTDVIRALKPHVHGKKPCIIDHMTTLGLSTVQYIQANGQHALLAKHQEIEDQPPSKRKRFCEDILEAETARLKGTGIFWKGAHANDHLGNARAYYGVTQEICTFAADRQRVAQRV